MEEKAFFLSFIIYWGTIGTQWVWNIYFFLSDARICLKEGLVVHFERAQGWVWQGHYRAELRQSDYQNHNINGLWATAKMGIHESTAMESQNTPRWVKAAWALTRSTETTGQPEGMVCLLLLRTALFSCSIVAALSLLTTLSLHLHFCSKLLRDHGVCVRAITHNVHDCMHHSIPHIP